MLIRRSAVLALFACSSVALAGEGLDVDSAFRLDTDPKAATTDGAANATPTEPNGTSSAFSLAQDNRPYTAVDSRWWSIGTGITHDFDGATDINVHLAYTYFIAERFEFTGELGVWHYNQPGDNALGLNPCMVFRYHWYRDEDWTAYVDAGIGLLFTTDKVPQGGTDFDLTPRFGVGVTRRITDDLRLQAGLRWAHVSNARIQGDLDNPSRDGPMLYVGMVFRF